MAFEPLEGRMLLNVAPVATDDVYSVAAGQALTVAAPGVLANDLDADGDQLTAAVVDSPLYGSLALNSDGSFLYTPGPDFLGTDVFTYNANDGTLDSNVPGIVHVRVEPPNLVEDINTVTYGSLCGGYFVNMPTQPYSWSGYKFVEVGGKVFFTANDGNYGMELWVSDGTPAGTMIVKDIVPGPGTSCPDDLTSAGGTVYFTADDGIHGRELWKSDGTAAGTVMVRDINPERPPFMAWWGSGSRPSQLTNVSGTLYFTANDSYLAAPEDPLGEYVVAGHGRELWKSDGTEAGTVLVKDIHSGWGRDDEFMEQGLTAWGNGPLSSVPNHLVNVNGILYFAADDGNNGRELWRSDGTEAGTVLVKAIDPEPWSYRGPSDIANVNGTVYFSIDDGLHGPGLWKSDGSEAGTVLVKNWQNSGVLRLPMWLTSVDSTVYFVAWDPEHGNELWTSDGTEAGTVLLKDFNPTADPGFVPFNELANVNGTLYFTADDGLHGMELWKSDGTETGTVLVKDINPGLGDCFVPGFMFTDVNGTLYFFGEDETSGLELWKSDGTETGTVLVKDINLGPGGCYDRGFWAGPLLNVNGILYFGADDGTTGVELWKSDGTDAGTVLVKDINTFTVASFCSANLIGLNGNLFFTPDDTIHGRELWVTDGTDGGTMLLADINPGRAGAEPSDLTTMNGSLYFSADDGIQGRGLWKSDGTSAGTVLVKGLSAVSGLMNVNGTLYFGASDPIYGQGLWKSDGTEEGTVLVKDVYPGDPSSEFSNLTNVGGALFFTVLDLNTYCWELWKSDGTEGGTVMVKDDITAPEDYPSGWENYKDYQSYWQVYWQSRIVGMNGRLYFAAWDADSWQYALWQSDGTQAGTVLVESVAPENLTNVDGTLFFSVRDSVEQLWKSDGTEAGTVLVGDIISNPNQSGAGINDLTNVNGILYFAADVGGRGWGLWKSDGTEAGTALVQYFSANPRKSGEPVPPGSNDLTNVNGTLYFGANSAELWLSDGTEAGTMLVADLNPRTDVGTPEEPKPLPGNFTCLNGALYFTAVDSVVGDELWVLALTARDDVAATEAATAVAIGVLANDAGLNQGDVLTITGATAPGHGTALIDDRGTPDPSDDRILYTPAPGFAGTDTFTYRIGNRYGLASTATVTVLVNAPVNSAPVLGGVPGSAVIDEEVAYTFTATAGDRDLPVQTLTFSLIGAPDGASIDPASGVFTWTPTEAQGPGSYAFTVAVSDGVATTEAPIWITVNATNTMPTAESQTLATMIDTAIEVTLGGSDKEGETLQADLIFTITSLPEAGLLTHGELPVNVGDTFTTFTGLPTLIYTPPVACDVTSASFTFTVTDTGEGSAALTSELASVAINFGHYSGLSVNDGILRFGGTAAVDTVTSCGGALVINGAPVSTTGVTEIRIWAGDGNDTIDLGGLAIAAFVCGGAGDDTITGSWGNDLLLGGGGNDSITGGAGHDFLIGGAGADRLVGSAGNDILASGDFGPDATVAALRAVQAFWADRDVSSDEPDAVDAIFEEDGNADILTGSAGADWFIISLGDRITDLAAKLKDLVLQGTSGQYGEDRVTFVS